MRRNWAEGNSALDSSSRRRCPVAAELIGMLRSPGRRDQRLIEAKHALTPARATLFPVPSIPIACVVQIVRCTVPVQTSVRASQPPHRAYGCARAVRRSSIVGRPYRPPSGRAHEFRNEILRRRPTKPGGRLRRLWRRSRVQLGERDLPMAIGTAVALPLPSATSTSPRSRPVPAAID